MRRTLQIFAGVLLGMALTASGVQQSIAKSPITRIERCSLLNHQLQQTLTSNAAANQATAARALQKKATRLCASKRQAQGILTFANALKMLGVKPVDPDHEAPQLAVHKGTVP